MFVFGSLSEAREREREEEEVRFTYPVTPPFGSFAFGTLYIAVNVWSLLFSCIIRLYFELGPLCSCLIDFVTNYGEELGSLSFLGKILGLILLLLLSHGEYRCF